MSLFGGDLPSGASTDDELAVDETYPPRSSPPHEQETRESIEHDPVETYESSGSEYDSEEEDRPNKFSGPPQTWRKYTAKERDLASSLAQLRADDLSCHLYNAHALRRLVQSDRAATAARPWHSKARWTDKEKENDWIPPWTWTDWPLEPDQVPRAHEKFAGAPEIDPENEFTIREEAHLRQKPSQDLEEILTGLVQKRAKEIWEQREWENVSEGELMGRHQRYRGAEINKRARSRDKNASRTASRSKSRAGSPTRDADGNPPNGRRDVTATEKRNVADHNFPKPVVMVDDERAHQILRPTVRSMLSKLDVLLTNLHHSRKNHWDNIYVSSDDEGEVSKVDDTVPNGSDIESSSKPVSRRKRGRPPKPLLRTSSEQPVTTDTEPEMSSNSAERKRGRPRKYTDRLPGESYYMMRKRYEREQESRSATPFLASPNDDTQPSPLLSASTPNSPSKRPRRSSIGSTASGTSIHSERSYTGGAVRKLNPRDWSEVVGMAALSGFKPEVVQRAAQRCANLFGEGMVFTTFAAGEALDDKEAERVVEYRPEAVPSLSVSENEGEDEDLDEGEANESSERETGKKRPFWDGHTLSCPHNDCPRNNMPYLSRWRLNEHTKRKHGYKILKNRNETVGPNEDVHGNTIATTDKPGLVGGVHNDGFMQPIPARYGWADNNAERRPNKKHKVEGNQAPSG